MSKKLIFISILLILIGIVTIYLNTYYKASNTEIYLKSTNNMEVIKIDNGYLFDGPGTKDIIILYPGAKVEYTSYAPLMNKLSSKGIDTVLINMPFNIAFFNPNACKSIIDNYKYDNYYLMGHSLGGVVASSYVNKDNNIDGLILLASYPTKKINNNIKLLSIYGDKDGVLNIKQYNKNKKYFPKYNKEIIIKGGNHANFGNYGIQNKDGQASISRNKQQDITINEIINFINIYK